jgi:hypothetical protein
MSEPPLPESDRLSKNTYPQRVFCSQHKCGAEIIAATRPHSNRAEATGAWLIVP